MLTDDDLIRMAREAGLCSWVVVPENEAEKIAHFAALVAAAKAEEIAKMFDGEVWSYDYREIAAAIRARGNE